MSKIPNLEINFESVAGWDRSGGKSMNIWGQVPTSNLPFDDIFQSIKNGKKSCVWTCYDKALYSDNTEKETLTEFVSEKLKNLPKTMSATFKPTYSKYSVVAENLGMKIAMLLNMPTSYNYIVKFDRNNEKFKPIIDHLQQRHLKSLQDYGIVSIDFLQPSNVVDEKLSIAYSGDRLILFDDSFKLNNLKISSNPDKPMLVQTWIESLKKFIFSKRGMFLEHMSMEKFKEQIRNVESRIARSFLLREFLGDCDFTDLNSGFIINEKEHTFSYAPNFDYGESFNALIKTKLDYLPPIDEIKTILQWEPDYVKKKELKRSTPTRQLAESYASITSKQNIKFVLERYPKDAREFLFNLDKAIKNESLVKLVDTYTDKDTPLLSKDTANLFKIYLSARGDFFRDILRVATPEREQI